MTAKNGALEVIPGSHHRLDLDLPASEDGDVGRSLETGPGDIIVLDERIIHGSRGGNVRHQWRVDFVVDPHDDGELVAVRAWYDQSFRKAEPDIGYDPTLYPSWGGFWRSLERPWSRRLRSLGLDR